MSHYDAGLHHSLLSDASQRAPPCSCAIGKGRAPGNWHSLCAPIQRALQRILELSPVITTPDKHVGFLTANRSLRKPFSASLEKCFCRVCDKSVLKDICALFLQQLFVVEGASMIFSPW